MRKLVLVVSLLVPLAASADDIVKMPEPTAAFASWTPAQQWMPELGQDPRSDHGYSSLSGMLLLADELGDRFSELGRASLIQKCFRNAKDGTGALLQWALCGSDVKALDMKKLAAELAAEKVTGEAKAEVIKTATEAYQNAKKLGAAIEAAAKDDPGVQAVLKLADAAKSEWAGYLAKHKADFDRYLALKDAVRSGKSNNAGFKGCYEASSPAFVQLVKATAPKIPWDVGGDYVPGYMRYLTATTEGYITTVSWAACAWAADRSGETPYSGAAAQEFGGNLHAGWRTIALGKALDEKFQPKFADRSLSLDTYAWKNGVSPAGTSVSAPIMTRNEGVIGKLTAKDEMSVVAFKGDKVESCLRWADSNKVSNISSGGNVNYEKKCLKRGMIDNQVGESEVPTKYLTGAKIGDSFAEVNKFPVVAWKAKKLTMLFGVPLK